jgi:hypothetical protein
LPAKPTIADFTYKDYKMAKQMREPLKFGEDQKEIYLRLETMMPLTSLHGETVQAGFCYNSINGDFARIEKVQIELVARESIP